MLQGAHLTCNTPDCYETKGLKRCSGCKVVRYCSVKCQKAHRRVHKATCTPEQPGGMFMREEKNIAENLGDYKMRRLNHPEMGGMLEVCSTRQCVFALADGKCAHYDVDNQTEKQCATGVHRGILARMANIKPVERLVAFQPRNASENWEVVTLMPAKLAVK